jgi:deoxyguanosine kinase
MELSSKIRYLCIEGVIGAGKTTLCRMFGEKVNARLVLEEAEMNPFLPEFYDNKRNFAFQTQLWFLVSRYKQLSESIIQEDLFHRCTIADYVFAKDKIFAYINLDENELGLYNSVASILERQVAAPDLVVYLQATTDTLLRRIEKRGRPYEYNMDRRYIEILNEAYNHFFFHYTQSPVLIIGTDEIDFVKNEKDFDDLCRQICNFKPGITYYRPIGSR